MTRIECERLVERYLEGGMDSAAEQDFFIQVALDNELRQTLKAYRIVQDTIRKERELGMSNHVAARQLLAGLLLPSPKPQLHPEEALAREEALLPLLRQTRVWRIVSILSGLALFCVGLVVFNQWERSSPDEQPPSVIQTAPSSGDASRNSEELSPTLGEQRPLGPSAAANPASAAEGTIIPGKRIEAGTSGAILEREGKVTEETSSSSGNALPDNHSVSDPSGTVDPEQTNANQASSESELDSTVSNTLQPDKIHLPVQIDWGEGKKKEERE